MRNAPSILWFITSCARHKFLQPVRKPSQTCGEGFLFGGESCLGGPPNFGGSDSIFGCLLDGYYIAVAPVTSTIRGVPSEVVLNEEDGMKSPCAVNLHNAVTVSQQRLGRLVAQLSSARMNEVCAALRFSLGCDSN